MYIRFWSNVANLLYKFIKNETLFLEVCGTYEQCIYILFTKDQSTVAAEEKKKEKKEREIADAARLSAIQTYT